MNKIVDFLSQNIQIISYLFSSKFKSLIRISNILHSIIYTVYYRDIMA